MMSEKQEMDPIEKVAARITHVTKVKPPATIKRGPGRTVEPKPNVS